MGGKEKESSNMACLAFIKKKKEEEEPQPNRGFGVQILNQNICVLSKMGHGKVNEHKTSRENAELHFFSYLRQGWIR